MEGAVRNIAEEQRKMSEAQKDLRKDISHVRSELMGNTKSHRASLNSFGYKPVEEEKEWAGVLRKRLSLASFIPTRSPSLISGDTRNLGSETRDPKPESRNPRPETRDPNQAQLSPRRGPTSKCRSHKNPETNPETMDPETPPANSTPPPKSTISPKLTPLSQRIRLKSTPPLNCHRILRLKASD